MVSSVSGAGCAVAPVIVVRTSTSGTAATTPWRGVALTVPAGEAVVIVSTSGSGKPTFIRVLNRMECHERGDVIVNGAMVIEDVRDIDVVRRSVGMVFQDFNLFSHMTVLENVALAPRRALKLERREAEAAVLDFLRRVGMDGRRDRYPHQLSGGVQQRVAIAGALAMRPEVMLFEEPASNLDAEMACEALNVMRDLAAARMTIMAITHEIPLCPRGCQAGADV